MKTQLSERGQIVVPKKIREAIHVGKGGEFEVDVVGKTIVLKPLRRFKARKWQDYVGIGEGMVDSYLKDKKKEKRDISKLA